MPVTVRLPICHTLLANVLMVGPEKIAPSQDAPAVALFQADLAPNRECVLVMLVMLERFVIVVSVRKWTVFMDLSTKKIASVNASQVGQETTAPDQCVVQSAWNMVFV